MFGVHKNCDGFTTRSNMKNLHYILLTNYKICWSACEKVSTENLKINFFGIIIIIVKTKNIYFILIVFNKNYS